MRTVKEISDLTGISVRTLSISICDCLKRFDSGLRH